MLRNVELFELYARSDRIEMLYVTDVTGFGEGSKRRSEGSGELCWRYRIIMRNEWLLQENSQSAGASLTGQNHHGHEWCRDAFGVFGGERDGVLIWIGRVVLSRRGRGGVFEVKGELLNRTVVG